MEEEEKKIDTFNLHLIFMAAIRGFISLCKYSGIAI